MTLDTARGIVRQPGLHLLETVLDAILVMKAKGDHLDWNEANMLQNQIDREGRPVRHDEMRDHQRDDHRNHDAIALRMMWPQVVQWTGIAALVYSGVCFGIPLAVLGLQTAGRFVWGL